jgi:hypothetical protein
MFGPSTPAATTGLDNTNTNTSNNNNPNPNVNPSSSIGDSSGLFDNPDWANPNNEMWYLPTGAAFFQNIDNNAVSMTAEGVNVGGLDLLEYMAMDPMDHHNFGMDGNGF